VLVSVGDKSRVLSGVQYSTVGFLSPPLLRGHLGDPQSQHSHFCCCYCCSPLCPRCRTLDERLNTTITHLSLNGVSANTTTYTRRPITPPPLLLLLLFTILFLLPHPLTKGSWDTCARCQAKQHTQSSWTKCVRHTHTQSRWTKCVRHTHTHTHTQSRWNKMALFECRWKWWWLISIHAYQRRTTKCTETHTVRMQQEALPSSCNAPV